MGIESYLQLEKRFIHIHNSTQHVFVTPSWYIEPNQCMSQKQPIHILCSIDRFLITTNTEVRCEIFPNG